MRLGEIRKMFFIHIYTENKMAIRTLLDEGWSDQKKYIDCFESSKTRIHEFRKSLKMYSIILEFLS